MLPFIIGGVALAVTGYGIKKYLEDESNCEKLEDAVDSCINAVEKQTNKFFDFANKTIDELDELKNGKKESYTENKQQNKPCENIESIEEIQDIEQSNDLVQDKNLAQTNLWYRPFDWTIGDNKQNEDSTVKDEKTTQTKSWHKTSDWI